jgi:octaprenyl-diphosphate synthase
MVDPTVSGLFASVYSYIDEAILPAQPWTEFKTIFHNYRDRRASSLHAYIDTLPLHTCVAAGGQADRAIPLAAAWVFYILAARVFDDLQDSEGTEYAWNGGGLQGALPIGLYAIGAAQTALSFLDKDRCAKILGGLGNTLALSAIAQSRQVTLDSLSTEEYFEILAAKTGFVFAAGARAGALMAAKCVDTAVVEALYEYGLNTGIAAQIADDCYDLVEYDLQNNTLSLPIIYALAQKQHVQYPQFLASLRDLPAQPTSREIITGFLKKVGAVEWSLRVARVYQIRALAALEQFPEETVQPLINYVSRNLNVPP